MEPQKVLNSGRESVIINRNEYDTLVSRVATLETLVKEFLFKQRELAIIQMGDIEDRLGMPRTKEKRK